MVKLICKRVNPITGEKFPTKKEIASFANRLINDYCRKFNKKPETIDFDEFIHKYLEIDIQYQILSNDKSILGTTIQKDCKIVTYSYDGSAKVIDVKKGDIFVDPEACGCLEREYFTSFHEIKHFLIDLNTDFRVDRIIDDAEVISGKLHSKTKLGWAEYFANYFAACIMLSRRRLKKIYDDYHYTILTQYHTNLKGSNIKYLKMIIKLISEQTMASQSAIAIRLKETGLITKDTFDRLGYKFGKEGAMLFRLNNGGGNKNQNDE